MVFLGGNRSSTRFRVTSSKVFPFMIGQNCFGRSSPAILLVRGRSRVPSPPARITAHLSCPVWPFEKFRSDEIADDACRLPSGLSMITSLFLRVDDVAYSESSHSVSQRARVLSRDMLRCLLLPLCREELSSGPSASALSSDTEPGSY